MYNVLVVFCAFAAFRMCSFCACGLHTTNYNKQKTNVVFRVVSYRVVHVIMSSFALAAILAPVTPHCCCERLCE